MGRLIFFVLMLGVLWWGLSMLNQHLRRILRHQQKSTIKTAKTPMNAAQTQAQALEGLIHYLLHKDGVGINVLLPEYYPYLSEYGEFEKTAYLSVIQQLTHQHFGQNQLPIEVRKTGDYLEFAGQRFVRSRGELWFYKEIES